MNTKNENWFEVMTESNNNMCMHLAKKPESRMHRALFIDGGGTKGIFASEIIDNMGKEEYEKFNILSGTSIGAILLLAYETHEFNEVNSLLIKKLKKVFNTSVITKGFNFVFKGALYNYRRKEKVFQNIFGLKKVSDLPKEKSFFITTTNFATGEPEIIENVTGKWDNLYLWQVAMYTSDAPIYFNNKTSPYIDGGIYANDPRGIYLTLLLNKQIADNVEKFLSIGLRGEIEEVDLNELNWIKKASRLLDIMININALNNNKWFDIKKNKEKHLRVSLKSSGKIPVNKLNRKILKLFRKQAKELKNPVLEFLK